MLLLTEFFIINFFLVADLFLFFVFFECILLPMYLLIGIWGSNLRKIYASYQFFFFTFFGSIFMFLSVVLIYNLYGTTDFLLIQIYLNKLTGIFKLLVCIFFMIAFFIKIPVVPFHFWLPEAHVEAPTSGSVILAGLLLKLGAYGLIRFLLPLFSDIIVFLNPVLVTICIYSIIYISFIILRQLDLKRIIAYSSIIHMNFILLGLVISNKNTIIGGIFLLISHGIVSSALFICIGFLYERYHTRVLLYYKGISVVMPIYSIFFFIFMLANASLPGTSNFTGEFLVILGIFEFNNFLVFFLLLGLFYSALINF
jgi:proton-translocating NADH-quinone oxidoreductase chain M